jgi:hypothetical protein
MTRRQGVLTGQQQHAGDGHRADHHGIHDRIDGLEPEVGIRVHGGSPLSVLVAMAGMADRSGENGLDALAREEDGATDGHDADHGGAQDGVEGRELEFGGLVHVNLLVASIGDRVKTL